MLQIQHDLHVRQFDNPAVGVEVHWSSSLCGAVPVCISFGMFDCTLIRTHWQAQALSLLVKHLRAYSDALGSTSMWHWAGRNPGASLPLSPLHAPSINALSGDLSRPVDQGDRMVGWVITGLKCIFREPTVELSLVLDGGEFKRVFLYQTAAQRLLAKLQESSNTLE